MKSTLTAAALALACTFCASGAAAQPIADDRSLVVGYQPAWFVLAGATGGASFGSDENGGFLGGELSVARMFRGWWYGLYGDASYDFGTRMPTATIGPEFGYWVLGVDGGIGLRPGEDSPVQVGPTVRGLLTLGLAAVYYRHSFWPSSIEHRNVRQVGVMLKLPIGAAWGSGPPSNMGRRRQ